MIAAPPVLGSADAKAIPTWRAAYSDRTAALMATFCELAYDARADVEAAIRPAGFEVKAWVEADGMAAFLAVNHAEFAVLAFRGTDNFQGWELNLDAIRVPLASHPGVWVHAGFWKAWACMAAEIWVAAKLNVPDDLGLYVTGHSLGGAMAQIAAAELERDNLAACYTFGSPRVATVEFDALVKCPHYRIVHGWDLVPSVPPAFPGGFMHSGDPRLLVGGRPACALRRDRALIPRFAVDLWSLLVWPWLGQFGAVDDHMIWAYRAALDGIAAARNGGA